MDIVVGIVEFIVLGLGTAFVIGGICRWLLGDADDFEPPNTAR